MTIDGVPVSGLWGIYVREGTFAERLIEEREELIGTLHRIAPTALEHALRNGPLSLPRLVGELLEGKQ